MILKSAESPVLLKTLGILGGMGPAATAQFMRLLVAEFNAVGIYEDADFPQMIMLSLNLALEDWDHTGTKNSAAVRDNVRAGLDWLKAAGADIVAVPCNSVHEFVSGDKSAVSIVEAALRLCKVGPIGVLCSAQTRNSGLYEGKGHKIQYYPNQESVDSIIHSAMRGMRVDISLMINAEFSNCPSVILGCTELSLCSVRVTNGGPLVVDSNRALAQATVKRLI